MENCKQINLTQELVKVEYVRSLQPKVTLHTCAPDEKGNGEISDPVKHVEAVSEDPHWLEQTGVLFLKSNIVIRNGTRICCSEFRFKKNTGNI